MCGGFPCIVGSPAPGQIPDAPPLRGSVGASRFGRPAGREPDPGSAPWINQSLGVRTFEEPDGIWEVVLYARELEDVEGPIFCPAVFICDVHWPSAKRRVCWWLSACAEFSDWFLSCRVIGCCALTPSKCQMVVKLADLYDVEIVVMFGAKCEKLHLFFEAFVDVLMCGRFGVHGCFLLCSHH